MTDEQIRLYALARISLPCGWRIRSYRVPFDPARFPAIGIEATSDFSRHSFRFEIEDRLLIIAPERFVLQEIRHRVACSVGLADWNEEPPDEDNYFGAWNYQRLLSGGV